MAVRAKQGYEEGLTRIKNHKMHEPVGRRLRRRWDRLLRNRPVRAPNLRVLDVLRAMRSRVEATVSWVLCSIATALTSERECVEYEAHRDRGRLHDDRALERPLRRELNVTAAANEILILRSQEIRVCAHVNSIGSGSSYCTSD